MALSENAILYLIRHTLESAMLEDFEDSEVEAVQKVEELIDDRHPSDNSSTIQILQELMAQLKS